MCTLNFSNKLNLKRKKEIDTPSPFISLAKSRQVLIGLSGQDVLVKVTLFAGVQSFGENICHRCDQDKYIFPEYICPGHICPGYHQVKNKYKLEIFCPTNNRCPVKNRRL